MLRAWRHQHEAAAYLAAARGMHGPTLTELHIHDGAPLVEALLGGLLGDALHLLLGEALGRHGAPHVALDGDARVGKLEARQDLLGEAARAGAAGAT